MTEVANNEVNINSIKAESERSQQREPESKTAFYALWVLMFFFPLAGLILAYVKKGTSESDFEKSHLSYAIRTFWWGALWFILGTITSFFVIGVFVLIIASIWYLYRVIKGFIRVIEGASVK